LKFGSFVCTDDYWEDYTRTRWICRSAGIYLQAIQQLFKDNRFCKDEFVALGKTIGLRDITCPTFLMAGAGDDITPYPQVFAAEKKLSTPKDQTVKKLAPGGHIGLFMGSRTLKDSWPGVVAWIKQECPSA